MKNFLRADAGHRRPQTAAGAGLWSPEAALLLSPLRDQRSDFGLR